VIGAVCLLAGGRGLTAVWTGNPLADAFVTTGPTNNLSDNNYGGAGALGISGSGASHSGTGFRGLFDSVMKFDLSGAKASFDSAYGVGQWTISSITLSLATTTANNAIFNDNSGGQFEIRWMEDDSWTEGTGNPNAPGASGITYNSLPDYVGINDESMGVFSFDASTGGADGTVLTYTLTAGSGLTGDMQDGSVASLEFLPATDGSSYLFNSSSFGTASRRPLLTVAAVPEPTVWGLCGVAVVAGLILRSRARRG